MRTKQQPGNALSSKQARNSNQALLCHLSKQRQAGVALQLKQASKQHAGIDNASKQAAAIPRHCSAVEASEQTSCSIQALLRHPIGPNLLHTQLPCRFDHPDVYLWPHKQKIKQQQPRHCSAVS